MEDFIRKKIVEWHVKMGFSVKIKKKKRIPISIKKGLMNSANT